MSEENYNYMIKKAVKQFAEDIKREKTSLLVVAGYLFFMEVILQKACPFVVVTGFPCPACGLTRAGIHLLKGEWVQAWEINLMIYPVAALVAAAVIFRYFLNKPLKGLVPFAIILVLAMTAYYIYRMASQFPGEPPMSYYYDNFIVRVVKWLRM